MTSEESLRASIKSTLQNIAHTLRPFITQDGDAMSNDASIELIPEVDLVDVMWPTCYRSA